MVKPLLVTNLVKDYWKNGQNLFRAVDALSFSVERGECFGLLGPNGAGKSTTIHCLTGFYPATKGEVLIEGYNAHLEPKLARSFLGVCPQEDSLDSDFSLINQLIRHASYFKIPPDKAREEGLQLLDRFGLIENQDGGILTLSGGMKRRFQIARALISKPTILVLDEPTTGLDPEARRIVWDALIEFKQRGTAILLTTHYMDEAERLCDRIGLMYHGKILEIATPAELILRHIGSEMVEEEVRPGVVIRRPPNLEDIFLKLASALLGNDNGSN